MTTTTSAPPLSRPHTFTPPPCWTRQDDLDDLEGRRSFRALVVWTIAIALVVPARTRGVGVLALVTLLSRAHGHAHRRLRGEFYRLFAERESVRRQIVATAETWTAHAEDLADEVARDAVSATDALERWMVNLDERLTDLAADIDRTLQLAEVIATPQPDAEDVTT